MNPGAAGRASWTFRDHDEAGQPPASATSYCRAAYPRPGGAERTMGSDSWQPGIALVAQNTWICCQQGRNSPACMSITQFLSEEFIIVPMYATDRSSALLELLRRLEQHQVIQSAQECLESILVRERRMSTGVGKGVALPHGRSNSVSDVVLVMGVSQGGIDFNAVDGLLCHVFVLFVSPVDQPDKHLKLLSRINKLLSDSGLRSALMEAGTPENLLKTLHAREDEEKGDLD